MPAGTARIEALRGFEYTPAAVTIEVKPGATHVAALRLERLADLPAGGCTPATGTCTISTRVSARRTSRSSGSRRRARAGRARRLHASVYGVAKQPSAAASTLIALDAALGLGDYYDIGALYSDERASADFYFRLLNAGFRIAATGGTDNFSDVWIDPPPGSDRTFARITGPLTMGAWFEAIKRGRTFFSSGPLVRRFEVDGRGPGDEIAMASDAPSSVRVAAEVVSIAPIESVEVIVNGEAAQTVRAADPLRVAIDGRVEVPRRLGRAAGQRSEVAVPG